MTTIVMTPDGCLKWLDTCYPSKEPPPVRIIIVVIIIDDDDDDHDDDDHDDDDDDEEDHIVKDNVEESAAGTEVPRRVPCTVHTTMQCNAIN